jgi:uncharacterized membrane protein
MSSDRDINQKSPIDKMSIKHYLKSANGLTSLVLLLFTACGTWVRISDLSKWYWSPDDALHIAMSSGKTLLAVIQNIIAEDTHPPLYYLLLHTMLLISKNELFLRSLSLVPGLLLIPLSYFMGKLAIGRVAGIFIAFIAAFGNATILASEVLRQYPLFLCMISGAFCCMLAYNHLPKKRYLFGYSALMLLGLFTHFTSVIVIASMGIMWFFLMLYHKNYKHVMLWMLLHAVLVICSGILYYYFIMPQWMGQAVYREAALTWWLIDQFPGYHILPYITALAGLLLYISFPYQLTLSVAMIFLSTIGVQQLIAYRQFNILILCALLLAINISLTLAELYPFSPGRHCIYLWPFLMMIPAFAVQKGSDNLAALLRKLSAEKADNRMRTIAGILLLSAISGASFHLSQVEFAREGTVEFPLKKSSFDKVTKKIEDDVQRNDLIITEKQVAFYFFGKTLLNHNRKDISPELAVVHYMGKDFYYPTGAAFQMWHTESLIHALSQLSSLIPLEKFNRIWFISTGWCDTSVLYRIALPQLMPLPKLSMYPNTTQKDKDFLKKSREDKEKIYTIGWQLFNDTAIEDRLIDQCYNKGGVAMFAMKPAMVKKYFLRGDE